MNESSRKPRRWSEPWVTWVTLVFLGINAIAVPIAVTTNTPSSVWGWLGAVLWEAVLVFALVDMWLMRRG
jgi:hypothetical protein